MAERLERIVREKERKEITGVCRTTAWKLQRQGAYPAPVALPGGRCGWLLSELEEWVRSRPRIRRGGEAA